MKKRIQALRLTAKLLLAAVPAILVTGFLTAKPGLLDASQLSAFRWLHTRLVPLVLVPLLLAHSLAGVLFMVGRNKRLDRAAVHRGLWGAWALIAGLLIYLYVAEPAAVGIEALTPTGAEPAGAGGALANATSTGAGARATGGSFGGASVGGAGASSTVPEVPDPLESAASKAVAAPTGGRPKSTAVTTRPSPRPSASPVAPTAPTATAASPSGPQLIQQRCVGCHGMDVVVAKKRTTAEWSAVLDQMIGYGAQLDAQERRLVMRYLPRQ